MLLNYMQRKTDMLYLFDIANSHGRVGEQTGRRYQELAIILPTSSDAHMTVRACIGRIFADTIGFFHVWSLLLY